jgi:cytochrome c
MNMSAHPQLSTDQTREMVKYILSLAEEKQSIPNMPSKGTLTTKAHVGKGELGTYFFSMAYTDKGGAEIGPLTSRKVITLQYPRLQAEAYDLGNNIARQGTRENTGFITKVKDGAYIGYENIDLTGVQTLTFSLNTRVQGSTIDVRIDSLNGREIGSVNLVAATSGQWQQVSTTIEKVSGLHTLYFVFNNKEAKNKDLLNLDWIYFKPLEQAAPASHSRAGTN